MSTSAIIRDTALSKQLTAIPVSELQAGMVVHAIAEQKGSLGVKCKGEVKNHHFIDRLRDAGVLSVLIESPIKVAGTGSKLKDVTKQKDPKTAAKSNGRKQQQNRNHKLDAGTTFSDLSRYLPQAEAIYANFRKQLAKASMASIAQKEELADQPPINVQLDFTASKQLVDDIYQSVSEHPDMLLCLSMILESDDYLAAHSLNVATIMCHFCAYLGMSKQECVQLALVGFLFDIGMLNVSEELLSKKEPLSHQEMAHIQQHVDYSLALLQTLDIHSEARLAIEQHHERLDKSGYPFAYSGSKIHKYSRILAIVDCYDALTTKRPFREQLSPAAAMKILNDPHQGYDQKLVLSFIKCMGVFPIGSLVVLSNKRIGLVTSINHNALALPVVKVFYSITGKHFVTPQYLNLAKVELLPASDPLADLHIVKPVLASQYDLNITHLVS